MGRPSDQLTASGCTDERSPYWWSAAFQVSDQRERTPHSGQVCQLHQNTLSINYLPRTSPFPSDERSPYWWSVALQVRDQRERTPHSGQVCLLHQNTLSINYLPRTSPFPPNAACRNHENGLCPAVQCSSFSLGWQRSWVLRRSVMSSRAY
jgi:hypothetical protein